MNRKWMAAGALAAILALAGGIVLGREVIEGDDGVQATAAPQTTRFNEPITGVSIAYPANWTRLQSADGEVRLRLVGADPSAALQMRVTKTGLAPVTTTSLPVAKQFTDGLLAQDTRAKQLDAPAPIELGGLPGWRYRYTYTASDSTTGAHVHYFLFLDGRMVQLVFQAVPATKLAVLEPAFDQIAGSFKSAK